MAGPTITVRRADENENPIAALTAVHIEVADAPANEWVVDKSVPVTYRLIVTSSPDVGGGSSVEFTPDAENGAYEWDGYVFPAAGSYTITLRNLTDSSDDATASVTVVDPS